MSFYGKITEPNNIGPLKTFWYRRHPAEASYVKAHDVYFYESGHVGFWKELPGEDRRLILAIRADEVWEGEE
jgi:hypothetical protein